MTTQDLFAPETKARATDPETSKAAARKVDAKNGRDELFEAVYAEGNYGLTLKEFCEANGYQMSSKSSRCTELEKEGRIFYRGDRRGGARVMRSINQKRGLQFCPECNGLLLKINGYACQSPRH